MIVYLPEFKSSLQFFYLSVTPDAVDRSFITHVNQWWSEPSLTCGGGSPPAPCGQSGSIRRMFSVLHLHPGDGVSLLQLPLFNFSQVE